MLQSTPESINLALDNIKKIYQINEELKNSTDYEEKLQHVHIAFYYYMELAKSAPKEYQPNNLNKFTKLKTIIQQAEEVHSHLELLISTLSAYGLDKNIDQKSIILNFNEEILKSETKKIRFFYAILSRLNKIINESM
jgi:hypothetical protein